jgi:hypothetical protein
LQRALAGEIALLACTHAIAELYAVLTRLPVSHGSARLPHAGSSTLSSKMP